MDLRGRLFALIDENRGDHSTACAGAEDEIFEAARRALEAMKEGISQCSDDSAWFYEKMCDDLLASLSTEGGRHG